jgi:hypothetical protein
MYPSYAGKGLVGGAAPQIECSPLQLCNMNKAMNQRAVSLANQASPGGRLRQEGEAKTRLITAHMGILDLVRCMKESR